MPLVESHHGPLDVVVIGGGAAGIGAARTLAAAGHATLLLEAGPRLGGRARTEIHRGFPLDLGCGWLHSANKNAWVDIAGAAGIAVDKTRPPWERQSCNHGLSPVDQAAFRAAYAAFDRRIERACLDPDRPAADFLEPGSRWNPLLDAVSTWFNGVELADMSALDYRNFEDTERDWRVPSGYGALVAEYARPAPAMVGTPALSVDHRGAMLRVITPRGTLACRAAVIAVPTPALARESLRFTPALPEKTAAAGRLPLGTVDKVFLACAAPEMFPQDGHLFGNPSRVATGSYHLRPFGRPMIECFIGGRVAKDLAEQGEARASTVFAIEELVASIGGDLRRKLSPLAASAWETETVIGGAYSHAQVGCVPAREALAQAVDGRLFFAGEACSTRAYSTAHGAFESGRRAAREVIAALEQSPSGVRSHQTDRSAEECMAKCSESAGKDVESAMRRRKKGTLKSGKGGKGGKVKSRKQAIAIGLSEARAKGKKVPKKKTAKKKSSRKRRK